VADSFSAICASNAVLWRDLSAGRLLTRINWSCRNRLPARPVPQQQLSQQQHNTYEDLFYLPTLRALDWNDFRCAPCSVACAAYSQIFSTNSACKSLLVLVLVILEGPYCCCAQRQSLRSSSTMHSPVQLPGLALRDAQPLHSSRATFIMRSFIASRLPDRHARYVLANPAERLCRALSSASSGPAFSCFCLPCTHATLGHVALVKNLCLSSWTL